VVARCLYGFGRTIVCSVSLQRVAKKSLEGRSRQARASLCTALVSQLHLIRLAAAWQLPSRNASRNAAMTNPCISSCMTQPPGSSHCEFPPGICGGGAGVPAEGRGGDDMLTFFMMTCDGALSCDHCLPATSCVALVGQKKESQRFLSLCITAVSPLIHELSARDTCDDSTTVS
jgi:hypothetical protein